MPLLPLLPTPPIVARLPGAQMLTFCQDAITIDMRKNRGIGPILVSFEQLGSCGWTGCIMDKAAGLNNKRVLQGPGGSPVLKPHLL